MPNFKLATISFLGITVLAIGSFALGKNTATSAVQDEPIIVKGGSLSVTCPGNTDCLGTHTNGKYSHRNQNGKITRIVVKATNGAAVFDSSAAGINVGGQPSVEIFYK